jgi:coenzyme F420-reducing hydrogenase alpha subunit
VSVRVGGFSRSFRRTEITALREALAEALEIALRTMDLVANLETPSFELDGRLVALMHPSDYPMNEGRIVSTDGLDLAQTDWRSEFSEQQVAWSNALQSRGRDGRPYLLGPAARITLAADQLHPIAASALAATDDQGLVAHAQIVPPTSQNQAAIEANLAAFAPRVLSLSRREATLRMEQLIRSYDPCISCATHFLDLSVENFS